MSMLRRRTHFRAYPKTKVNGVAVIGWVSQHDTLVNGHGDPGYIEAEKVYDPGRGVLCLQLECEQTFNRGGFANVDGKIRGILVGKVSGNIVILFSTIGCDPSIAAGRSWTDPACGQPPPIDARCLDPHSGRDCIYCVRDETPLPRCTIEQYTDTLPCGPFGVDGASRQLMYSGALIRPNPANWDIYGKTDPYYAQNGRYGQVKYYLKNFHGKVDPVLPPPWLGGDLCPGCGWWLCHIIFEYVKASHAWLLQCTEVEKDSALFVLGACCLWDGSCWDGLTREECAGLTFDPVNQPILFLGPGSQCRYADCELSHWPYLDACCLPSGLCTEYPPATCLDLGGQLMGLSDCLSPFCGEVQNPNLRPRQLVFDFPSPRVGFVEFSFAGAEAYNVMQVCFHLPDNFCFSGGTPGGDPDSGPWWSHTQEARKLGVIDSIDVIMDMRIGDDPARFPHREPGCRAIANAALQAVGERVTALTSPGHSQMNSYDHYTLNAWTHVQGFGGDLGNVADCGTSPAIAPVSVAAYKAGVAFPADVVLYRVGLNLYISGDPGNEITGVDDQTDLDKTRIAAVFTCQIELKVRLRPGWEDVPGADRLSNLPGDACDPAFADPEQYMILAGDGCTRVPLVVNWKGIQGPRPWSRGPFEYQPYHVGLCCTLLHAMDGLLIPGEVDDTDDPDAMQHYDGDVVIGIQEPFPAVGC